ncbi:MAG TPA: SRPBCC family protein [Trueperaceae bacterium]
MNRTKITAEPGKPTVIIERAFDAPKELLFRAYTEPELLAQWLGPRGYEMKVERLEARDGGRYRYIHTDPEGNEYGFRGVFHGNPNSESIIQTFEFEGWPGHVSLDSLWFEEREGKTVVRTVSSFQSTEDRDAMIESGMEKGVVQGHEQLDELLQRLPAVS